MIKLEFGHTAIIAFVLILILWCGYGRRRKPEPRAPRSPRSPIDEYIDQLITK